MRPLALIIVLTFLQGPAFALSAQEPQLLTDQPGGPWQGAVAEPVKHEPPASWSLRTGYRKGVQDQSLPEEIEAGPDIAVLGNGQHAAWPGLLAEFQEASRTVEPDAVAGLRRLKPVLVIPSGGLDGLGASAFFKAGLAEYVRAGGVLLCLAQRRGADLAALPAPQGASIDAAGWSEDGGPVFQHTAVVLRHPATAAIERPAPFLETSGYLKSFPANGLVLVTRQDGRPTVVLYPFGNGWVAVTALLSDFSFSQNLLSVDEKTLLRGLLLWGKAGGNVREFLPGAEVSLPIRIKGPVSGSAAQVRVRAVEAGRALPKTERLLPQILPERSEAVLTVTQTLPNDIEPGIYNFEYLLLDDKQHPLMSSAESADGWFSVVPKTPLMPPPPQPLESRPAVFSVQPALEQTGNTFNINFTITKIAGPAGAYDIVVRTDNRQKKLTLTEDTGSVSFLTVQAGPNRPVTYAFDHGQGGVIARGGVEPVAPRGSGVFAEKHLYAPGQALRLSVAGLGLGALVIEGLGTSISEHLSGDKSYTLPIPPDLPEGAYPVTWDFQTRQGDRRAGKVFVLVKGARVKCTNIAWPEAPPSAQTAVLQLESSQPVDAIIRLKIGRFGGTAFQTIGHRASLAAGRNIIAVPVTFRPDAGGLWLLRYDIAAPLPEGPGFSPEPLVLDQGRLFFDAGAFAVLGITADPPVSYLPRSAVTFETTLFAKSRGKAEFYIDGKRVRTETLPGTGAATISYRAKKPSPGRRRVGIILSGDGPESRREWSFLSGALLPDLAASIVTSGIEAPAIDIGVGVVNNGRTASDPARGALYEGDPDRGGARISDIAIPPLAPAATHVMIVPWPLGGKAGARTLTVVLDEDDALAETNEENNRASIALEIPELLLMTSTRQSSYAADTDASYQVSVANFTAEAIPHLTLALRSVDPEGRAMRSDSIPILNLASGGFQHVERTIGPGVPGAGVHRVIAEIAYGQRNWIETVDVTIRPTLAVKGSLAATPASAAPCSPLDIRYAIRTAGNLPVTGGSLMIEVRSKAPAGLVHAIQLPFALGEQTHRINKIDFPRGEYRITLRAAAENRPAGQSQDMLLDERPLIVKAPLEVTFDPAPLPRLLVWAGGELESSIEQALSEKILAEAIGEEGFYSKVVSSPEAFSREALSGLYTMFLLIDIDNTLDAGDVLRTVLDRGHSVILAGSNDRMRSLAEQLGFRFEAVTTASYVTFPEKSPLHLGGTVPFAGPSFTPSRKGARVFAVYSDDRPAVLSAREGKGQLIVIPFSLVRSSLAAGTSTLYSLLVRAALLVAVPEREEGGAIASVQMTVTAETGPVKARLSSRLPEGAKLLWANRASQVKNGDIVFDLTADRAAQRILYLYQAAKPDAAKRAVDVQYECEGAFVSQGKME